MDLAGHLALVDLQDLVVAQEVLALLDQAVAQDHQVHQE